MATYSVALGRYRRDDVEPPPPPERELLPELLPELKLPLDDEREVDEPIVLRLLDDELLDELLKLLLDDELLLRVVMPLAVEPKEPLLRVVEVVPPDTFVPEDFDVLVDFEEPDDTVPLLRVVEVL